MKKVLLFLLYGMITVGTVDARIGLGGVWSGTKNWRSLSDNFYAGLNLAQGDNQRVIWDFVLGLWGGHQYVSTTLRLSDYFIEFPLVPVLILYVGLGYYLDFAAYEWQQNAQYEVDLGVRLPFGLRVLLDRSVDIWAGMAPSLGFFSRFSHDTAYFDLGGGIGLEGGIRFWF